MNENPRLAQADARISEFLAADDVHFWAKDVMNMALSKDPVDAVHDLEAIYLLLEGRMNAMLQIQAFREEMSGEASLSCTIKDLLKLMEKEHVGVMTLAAYKTDGSPHFLVAMARDPDVADEIKQVVEDYHA